MSFKSYINPTLLPRSMSGEFSSVNVNTIYSPSACISVGGLQHFRQIFVMYICGNIFVWTLVDGGWNRHRSKTGLDKWIFGRLIRARPKALLSRHPYFE